MEPLDPVKNEESSGTSKRRTSILKMPRKSIRITEAEQQDNVVEYTKPSDKRISRRVSFAPANDVLLFSKDVKNTSPVRSPLQELISAVGAPQNRVQMSVTEDQQIAGMETLLKAPIQTSQQKDKACIYSGSNFGEKTMIFMDMTQSHTINIANEEHLLETSHGILPTLGDKTMMFDRSMDMTLSQTVNMTCDQDSSVLSQPTTPSGFPFTTQMIPGTQFTLRAEIDKENQAPKLMSKSVNKKLGHTYVGLFSPEDDMDMTEAQTGRIMANTVEDDPLQCLFPQEIYAQPDKIYPQTNPKVDRESPTIEPMQNASKQRLTVNFETKDCDGEKTTVFADGGFMDITQNHTVNIAIAPSVPSTQCWDNPASLKERKSITTRFPALSSKELDDPLQCLFPSQDMIQQKDSKLQRTSYCKGLEPLLKTNMLKRQFNIDSEEDSREKTVRFSVDDACMDVTRSHTVKISTDFQQRPDLDFLPVSGERTVRFTTNEAGMDMTQCLTVNIASDLVPNSSVVPKQEALQGSQSVPTLDLEFENFFASFSKPAVPKQKEMTTEVIHNKVSPFTKTQGQIKTPLSINNSRIIRETAKGGGTCDDDINMDIIEAQTGRITEAENLIYHNAGHTGMTSQQRRSELGSYTNKGSESSCKSLPRNRVDFDAEDFCTERTVRFAADDALMDVTRCHTVNISTDIKQDLPFSGEKTVRFDVNDAEMDVTQCHTVNIGTMGPSHGNLGLLPKYGEKTVRFNATDATMDVTRSHTVNIAFEPNESCNSFPKYEEKTVRFNANEAEIDVTRSHTVNITTDIDPELSAYYGVLPKFGEKHKQFNTSDACTAVAQSTSLNTVADPVSQSLGNTDISLKSVEKTLRFNLDDANMDVTKAHTVKIDVEPQVIQDSNFLPSGEEKTVQFTTNDAGMEVTQCLTVNIGLESEAFHSELNPVPPRTTMDCPAVKKREHSIVTNRRSRSLAGHSLNAALKTRKSVPWANPLINNTGTPLPETVKGDPSATPAFEGDKNNDLGPIQTRKAHVENGNSGFVSTVTEKPVNEVLQSEECQDSDIDMNMTEALTGHLLGQTLSEDPCLGSAIKDLPPSVEDGITEAARAKCEVEIRIQPDSLQINEKNNDVEALHKSECSPSEKDSTHSRKSRRMSLADIQSKIRRFSQMLNAVPDNVTVDSNTHHTHTNTPFFDPETDVDVDKTKSLPADEPDLKMDQVQTETHMVTEEEPLYTSTTPFKLETKQLMSRLSVVGFRPKLPQRSKFDETKKLDGSLVQAVGKPTKTVNNGDPKQAGNFDLNVSDINDEELGSYEDVSETLDEKSPESSFHEFELDQELQDEVFEEEFALVNEKKRPLPDEENVIGDEKRVKTANNTIILDSQSCTLVCDENITAAPTIHTETTDSSNCSHTGSLRGEATFESTSKQSLFESQLEDYASDVQRKFDDGTLTMMEFFKLFHIDFVIHNPRQSVVPGRVLSDTDCTLMDLSKDRHISYPKQLVYEADVRNLTEQVEGLKVRMRDLDKPLRLVNRTLWEEMENFSEAEFKSFGAKLKERHNLFRKMSKAQSHEMKEVLYAHLTQANVEEQRKLRGTIEETDVMLKSLDDCIEELEADLAAVEEGVKSHQQGLNKVTEALTNNEKATYEFEIQKKQNLNKVRRVKEETKNVERHLTILHTINEWKLGEITSTGAVYTFLHETLHLELIYEDSKGNDDEKTIANISFKYLLNDEKSQCHARLVHTLLSQFTQEQNWVKKYPTNKHVPQLLQDVSLVVSRCRHMGEELRRLKMWGSLRFDILDIHCRDTEVHIVFSSLKRFTKFEVVFSVSLTSQICISDLKSFKNFIGSTTVQHIEEIIASFTPAKNYLTKIIQKIHSSLLC